MAAEIEDAKLSSAGTGAAPTDGAAVPASAAALFPPARQRALWLELLAVAAPVFITMGGYTSMMWVDTWMLAGLGDAAATAAGNGGAVSFVPLCFGFGTLLLVNTLVSQAFGRNDRRACGQYFWQGIWIALVYGLLLLPSCFFAGSIFRALGHPERYIADETIYYQILTVAAVVKLLGTVVTQFLIGINRTVIVAVAAIVGVVFNLAGNWVLIYGKLGFPAMGVAGSALATSLSTLLELVITLSVIFGPRIRRMYFTLDWRPRRTELRAILVTGTPAGAAMIGEVGAWTAFNQWVIPAFGPTVMDANNYAFRYMLLSFMPAMGFGHAVASLVGRYIGRGQANTALRVAHIGFGMTCIYMLVCGAIFVAMGPGLMRIFTADPAIIGVGATILAFMGLYQFLDALYVVYNGGLRGAGDTRVPALVMIVLNWSMVVAGSYLVAYYLPNWGVKGPYIVLCVYGVCVGLFMLLRFQLGGWRRINLAAASDAESGGSTG